MATSISALVFTAISCPCAMLDVIANRATTSIFLIFIILTASDSNSFYNVKSPYSEISFNRLFLVFFNISLLGILIFTNRKNWCLG